MAYADDVTLKDAAAADKIFSRQLQETNRCTWIDQTSTSSEPRTMKISHRKEAIKGYPGEYQDRHTIEMKVTKKDATTGKLYSAVITVSMQIPLTGSLVRADYNNLITFFTNPTNGMITGATNVDKLLRNEL